MAEGFRYFPFVPVLLLLVAMKRPASMKRPAASRKKPARRQGETSGFGGRSVGKLPFDKTEIRKQPTSRPKPAP